MDKQFVNLLIDLLNIKGHSHEERPVADFILRYCRKHGVNAREDNAARKINGNAGNVLAWPKGTDPDKARILFCSHMDTVDVGNERVIKKSALGISAGKNHPIGLDNRLGVALMLKLLAEEKGDYLCAFTAQEEIGMFGAEEFRMPKGVKAIYNLDGSQSPGHFVTSTVGCVTFKINLTGLSTHAGINPNGGRSVIEMASHAIAGLRLGMPGSDESVNIGVIHAGTRSNVIPSQAEIIGEARANSLPKMNAVIRGIKAAFARSVKKYGGTMTYVQDDMFKPYAHGKNSPIVKAAAAAISRAGIKPVFGHYRGGSDANVFNFRGVPAVNLSIGAHNPHSAQEFARTKEMGQAYRIVKNLLDGAGQ